MRELFVLRFFVLLIDGAGDGLRQTRCGHCYIPVWCSWAHALVGGVPWDETSRVADSSSKPADIASVFRYARLYGGRKTGGLKSCVITGQGCNVACRFSCLTASLRSASQLQG